MPGTFRLCAVGRAPRFDIRGLFMFLRLGVGWRPLGIRFVMASLLVEWQAQFLGMCALVLLLLSSPCTVHAAAAVGG